MNAEELLRNFERVSDLPEAVARLREFVVQLAVTGRLLRPDSQWSATTLDALGNWGSGGTPLKAHAEYYGGDIPWLVIGDLNDAVVTAAETHITRLGLENSSARLVQPGTVLIAMYGSIGKLGIAGMVCATNQAIAHCSLHGDKVLTAYLFLLLRGLRRDLLARGQGVAQQNISQKILRAWPVNLPPLAEQHRIVAKVDELMALCDRLEAARAEREAARDRLTAVCLARLNTPDPETFAEDARFVLDVLPALSARTEQIKPLRQTILNLAVRGKLVAQDPRDEPAAALMDRIANDTAQHESGGRVRRRRDLPVLDVDRAPFDLPVSWVWARFPDLGYFGRGKSKHRPRNDPALFDGGTHVVIQTGDVARSRGVVRTHTSKYNEVGLAQSQKWPTGTLCITIAANIADTGILTFDACFPDSVVGFVPSRLFSNARYFEYFVRTAKANLLEFAPATAQKNINLEILESVLIPLPPLSEQRRIVARIDELMALCDQIEQSLLAAEHLAAQLLDALIYEAGESAESLEIAA
jgi:type I restriction enzyme S subunit